MDTVVVIVCQREHVPWHIRIQYSQLSSVYEVRSAYCLTADQSLRAGLAGTAGEENCVRREGGDASMKKGDIW